MSDVDLKHCPLCNNDLPIGEFGICAARKDGHNLYCKSCIRLKVAASRRAIREYKAARKKRQQMGIIEFDAPQYPIEIVRRLSPVEKVREAIYGGCRTQKEISAETRLGKDEIGDAIATLLLWTHEIKTRIVAGERMYFISKVEAKQINYPTSASLVEIVRKNCGPLMKGEKQIRRVA